MDVEASGELENRVASTRALADFGADRYATFPEGLAWHHGVTTSTVAVGGARATPGQASIQYDLPTDPYCYAEGRLDPDSIVDNIAASQL